MIALTRRYESGLTHTLWVNPDHIVLVTSATHGAFLELTNSEDSVRVEESPAEVVARIRAAKALAHVCPECNRRANQAEWAATDQGAMA